MILLVVALVFFGVGVDMLDIVVPWSSVQTILTLVEDGGEMIVATFMVAYAVGSVLRGRRYRAIAASGWAATARSPETRSRS